MADFLARLGLRSRRRLMVMAGAAIMAAMAGLWLAAPPAPGTGGETVMVTARPLVSRLAIIGTIEAGTSAVVSAPFEGNVHDKLFEFGARVEKGQVLLVMDGADVELRLREAQATALRAEQTMAQLQQWPTGPEVSRARAALLSSELSLADLRRKASETRILLDRGIVARMEWDALEQQLKTQELQHDAARRDLDSAVAKGNPANRRIAELELENARARLAEFTRQWEGAVIEAPMSGIVLRPPQAANAPAGAANIETGSRLTQGQALLVVAGLDRLAVTAKVDEIDVNRLSEGQDVVVTGDAFDGESLHGQISRISAQAAPSASGRGAAFEIAVIVEPPAPMRKRIRVGMTSTLTITLYRNDHALIVPPQAIRQGDSGAYVLRRQADGHTAPAAVTIGQTGEDGVEIISGINENDVIVLP